MKPTRLLLTLALLALPGLAGAAASPDFEWKGALARGKVLRVQGISGDVQATRASGSEATVTAVKSGKSDRLDEITIEATPSASGMTICVVYPRRHGGRTRCDARGMHGDPIDIDDASVDFTIHVPDGVRLEAEQVNGSIEASDLGGDVEAASVNGTIRIETRGLAQASTVNGSIYASMGRGSWSRAIHFSTVNGSIRLTLPRDVDADVSAASVNGSFRSDFPSRSTKAFWGGSGEMHALIGSGASKLRLSTVNGDIALMRSGERVD